MVEKKKDFLDEKILKKEAEKNLTAFLARQKQALSTFTKEPGLRYLGSEVLEKFVLKPREGVLYLPLSSFLEEDLDNNEILWHIYYALALYPDWKKNAREYLNRRRQWQGEIDDITYYLAKKVTSLMEEGEKVNTGFLREYVEKEILDFLFEIDRYWAFLRVLETCPTYRDQEEKGNIIRYMQKTKSLNDVFLSLNHRGFSKSFLFWSLYKRDKKIQEEIEEKFPVEIFSQSIYVFFHGELIKQITQEEGIEKRDPLVKAFLYPAFKKYWLEEIDSMDLSDSDQEGEKILDRAEKSSSRNKLEPSRKEVEESLEEILKEETTGLDSQEEGEYKKMEAHGISRDELALFNLYAHKTRTQREEMKDFWRRLLGLEKKQENVKKNRQPKGKLNVKDFINNYPEFVEAEEKESYKDLKIFDKYFLESQNKSLPEKIEISFLIDNSGSMNKEKIEATRKTLAVTLLSIQDFDRYLQAQAKKSKQKIDLLTETWFFGHDHYRVKNFEETKDLQKSKIIASITKIDGGGGTTDDGACLREIEKTIDSEKKKRIKEKKEYKIIFEITDGASTFPGASRDIVKKLIETGVEVYAIQIGKISKLDTKTFHYIWNDPFKSPHGLVLGEDVSRLSEELLKLVKKNLSSIFQGE